MRYQKFLVVLAACGVLGACVYVRADRLGEKIFDPRPTDWPIAVFDGEADVKRPFVKVAKIVGSSGGFGPGWAGILKDMKAKARTLGADALILRGDDSPVTAVDAYGNMERARVRSAVAVRYTGPANGRQ